MDVLIDCPVSGIKMEINLDLSPGVPMEGVDEDIEMGSDIHTDYRQCEAPKSCNILPCSARNSTPPRQAGRNGRAAHIRTIRPPIPQPTCSRDNLGDCISLPFPLVYQTSPDPCQQTPLPVHNNILPTTSAAELGAFLGLSHEQPDYPLALPTTGCQKWISDDGAQASPYLDSTSLKARSIVLHEFFHDEQEEPTDLWPFPHAGNFRRCPWNPGYLKRQLEAAEASTISRRRRHSDQGLLRQAMGLEKPNKVSVASFVLPTPPVEVIPQSFILKNSDPFCNKHHVNISTVVFKMGFTLLIASASTVANITLTVAKAMFAATTSFVSSLSEFFQSISMHPLSFRKGPQINHMIYDDASDEAEVLYSLL